MIVEHNQSANVPSGVGYDNKYKFNGKELDDATQMYYYGARYYDPRISIFVSVDPLAEQAPNWTPYRYAFNNPIMFTDPTGLFETRAEAKQWAKENDIKTGWFRDHKISKGENGIYSINNKSAGISYSRDPSMADASTARPDGVIESAYIESNRSFSQKASDIWNHPVTRAITGDKININGGIAAGGLLGMSAEGGIDILLRGPDAGIYIDPFNTGSANVSIGGGGQVFLTGGKSYFSGDVSNMTLNSVVGSEAYIGADIATPYGGVTGSISASFDPKNPLKGDRWYSGSAGATWGAKGSVQAGLKWSNTRIGVGVDGKPRMANALELNSR